jgi:hypothetical protein
MSALQLEVLLHCHTRVDNHPKVDVPVYKEAHEKLYAAGLLTFTSSGVYTSSVMGQVYVKRLLETPLPVQKWVFEGASE